MRVMVVYASHYGATKGIAEHIADSLRGQDLQVELMAAEAGEPLADLGFDAFVIGSAIHAGHWLRDAAEFVRENVKVLAVRPTWLFSSGPVGEKYVHEAQPDPKEITEFRRMLNVRDHVVFAGAFDPATADLSRAGWLERQFAKRVLHVGDFRNWPEIEAWALEIARELSSVPVALAR